MKFGIKDIILYCLIYLSGFSLSSSSTTETRTSTSTETRAKFNSMNKSKSTMEAYLEMTNMMKSSSKNTMRLRSKLKSKSKQIEYLKFYDNLFNEDNHNQRTTKQSNPINRNKDKYSSYSFKSRQVGSSENPSNQGTAAVPASVPTTGTNQAQGNTNQHQEGEEDEPEMLENWMAIASMEFRNTNRFPIVTLPNDKKSQIKYNNQNFRLNDAHNCTDKAKPALDIFFWFRVSKKHLYYSSTETDINVLGVIDIASIENVEDDETTDENIKLYCFDTIDTKDKKWKVCSPVKEIRRQWVCFIRKELGLGVDEECGVKYSNMTHEVIKDVVENDIIIPLPSHHCNEKWNYQQNGDDWECECKEGTEQSPIELPEIEKAIDSPVKPLFQYKKVSSKYEITTLDKTMEKGKPQTIIFQDGHLKILHFDLGKIVTLDGAVYRAEEITFHTPSNHRMNGKNYPLEVSIIHYGISKGDIAKQVVLSFLFEKKPGIYNNFINDIDFFNLPNPVTKERQIEKDLYIPRILYNYDPNQEGGVEIMEPFSFFTYQGSIPFPPCTERTITYVASKPMQIGSTALQLFHEALRIPDIIDQDGNVMVTDTLPTSSRNVQDVNGRPIFHYDHTKYCPPKQIPIKIKPVGHYEKVNKQVTSYFYVNGEKPSGLAGAFVVSNEEAKGKGYEHL